MQGSTGHDLRNWKMECCKGYFMKVYLSIDRDDHSLPHARTLHDRAVSWFQSSRIIMMVSLPSIRQLWGLGPSVPHWQYCFLVEWLKERKPESYLWRSLEMRLMRGKNTSLLTKLVSMFPDTALSFHTAKQRRGRNNIFAQRRSSVLLGAAEIDK